MKFHYDIEQRTEAWFRIKYGKVGGTTSSQLHSKDDTLLNKLIAWKLEEFDPTADNGFTSPDMQRGIDLEPDAIAEVSTYSGIDFIDIGWIQSDIPIIGISPDAVSEDGDNQAEVKCPSAPEHIKYLRGKEVPAKYAHQVVHAFAVNPNLKANWFASYRPECEIPLFVKKVTPIDMINLGTEKTPKMVNVAVAASEKRELARKLIQRTDETIEEMRF